MGNVCKINEVPFPFPYAQVLHLMLMVHTLVLPFLTAYLVDHTWLAAFLVLFITTSQWSLMYIPLELDHPFGDDDNDFCMNDIQHAMNRNLLTLLHPMAQVSPSYSNRKLSLVRSTAHVAGSSITRLTRVTGSNGNRQSNLTREVLQDL